MKMVKMVGYGDHNIGTARNPLLGEGGEGAAYKVDDYVVKIPKDATRLLGRFQIKLGKLTNLSHPYIMSPKGLVLGTGGGVIGFWMEFAKGEHMRRAFATSWHDRQRFTLKDTIQLVDRMRGVVQTAHKNGFLIVDANEFNWKIIRNAKGEMEPRIFDVDSWVEMGHIPAKLFKLPQIDDVHSEKASIEADWFAWAVVTFQIFTGLHPYFANIYSGRETQNMNSGQKMEWLKRRNISVFNKQAKVPNGVRPFSNIPAPLLEWYRDVFENGHRLEPPALYSDVTSCKGFKPPKPKTNTITDEGRLLVEEVFVDPEDPAVKLFHCGAAMLESGRVIDLLTKTQIGQFCPEKVEVIGDTAGHEWFIVAHEEAGEILLTCVDKQGSQRFSAGLKGSLLRMRNRLFVISDIITEILPRKEKKRVVPRLEQFEEQRIPSTRWFNGVGLCNDMFIAPFGTEGFARLQVKEIAGLMPQEAVCGENFIALRKGNTLLQLLFVKSFYQLFSVGCMDERLNIAILPKGVCVTIPEEGKLVIRNFLSGVETEVYDKVVSTEMILGNWGDKVLFIQYGCVRSMRMN